MPTNKTTNLLYNFLKNVKSYDKEATNKNKVLDSVFTNRKVEINLKLKFLV